MHIEGTQTHNRISKCTCKHCQLLRTRKVDRYVFYVVKPQNYPNIFYIREVERYLVIEISVQTKVMSSCHWLTCKCKYNFISPHLTLCGFFLEMNFKIGSRLSKSQSFSKYSVFASVLVIKECLSSLSRHPSQTFQYMLICSCCRRIIITLQTK